ncbi:MAG: hypothetical protein H6577_28340 [Lewinellaceae bacterium]|nr:hypothetical protein [Saprospiraceae bacterium]MCB9342057.1 hypothetical protein [Lewinellaceae bacterium]
MHTHISPEYVIARAVKLLLSVSSIMRESKFSEIYKAVGRIMFNLAEPLVLFLWCLNIAICFGKALHLTAWKGLFNL